MITGRGGCFRNPAIPPLLLCTLRYQKSLRRMDGEVFIYSGETQCGPGVREGPEGEDETGSIAIRRRQVGVLYEDTYSGRAEAKELQAALARYLEISEGQVTVK